MNMAGEGEARKLLGGPGMGCEVPECKPLGGGGINNFRKYIGKWTKIHRSTIPLHKCTLCCKQFCQSLKGDMSALNIRRTWNPDGYGSTGLGLFTRIVQFSVIL